MERDFGQQLRAEPAHVALALWMWEVALLELRVRQASYQAREFVAGRALQVHPALGRHRANRFLTRPRRGTEGGCLVTHAGALHREQDRIAHAGDMHRELEDTPAWQVAGRFELTRSEIEQTRAEQLLLGGEVREAEARKRLAGQRRV